MDRQRVVDAFVAVHQEIQEGMGESSLGIAPDSTPLTDFPGFDSKVIPSALRMVARKIGWSPPPGTRFKNLYVSSDGRTKLTIAQIAVRFYQFLGLERAA